MTTSRLVLMRHAKSDWFSGEGEDFLRPLSERGVRDARRMGQWLASEDLLPARIVSSPSRRTRETVDLVGEGAGLDLHPRTRWLDALYHASLDTLLAVVAAEAPAPALMVVGHNPGLEELLDHLLGVAQLEADPGKPFPTGAVYALDLAGGLASPARHSARLHRHQRPKRLPR